MHEPTYMAPRHLLFAVQAHSENVASLHRRLADVTRDEMPVDTVERVRSDLWNAAREFHSAILLAAAEGATSDELIGHGVTRDLAAEIDRRARQ